jgi:hypothetical protein
MRCDYLALIYLSLSQLEKKNNLVYKIAVEAISLIMDEFFFPLPSAQRIYGLL